jgi:hypothetical protein
MGSDGINPPNQVQQLGKAAPSGNPVAGRSEEPSFSFIQPTVVTLVERPPERFDALGQSLVPRGLDAIGRELQKQLKRVGCYAGALNGVWTTSTRQAMNAFTNRVNAKLPTDKPDTVLLALVQGYSTKVCGIPCPLGQSLSRMQECAPNALLARTNGRKLPAAAGLSLAKKTGAWTVTTTAADRAPIPPEGTQQKVEPPSSSVGPFVLGPTPHQHLKKQSQPPAKQEGSWAANFFKHRDRLSAN